MMVAPAKREPALTRERREREQLVSHELRTPLTVIRGSVDTLLVRHPGGGDQQDLLEATSRATVRLEEMPDVVLTAADRPDPRPLPAGKPGTRRLELAEAQGWLELAEVGLAEMSPAIWRPARSLTEPSAGCVG